MTVPIWGWFDVIIWRNSVQKVHKARGNQKKDKAHSIGEKNLSVSYQTSQDSFSFTNILFWPSSIPLQKSRTGHDSPAVWCLPEPRTVHPGHPTPVQWVTWSVPGSAEAMSALPGPYGTHWWGCQDEHRRVPEPVHQQKVELQHGR